MAQMTGKPLVYSPKYCTNICPAIGKYKCKRYSGLLAKTPSRQQFTVPLPTEGLNEFPFHARCMITGQWLSTCPLLPQYLSSDVQSSVECVPDSDRVVRILHILAQLHYLFWTRLHRPAGTVMQVEWGAWWSCVSAMEWWTSLSDAKFRD